MEYFVNLTDDTLEKLDEAIQKPLTVVEELKENVASLKETIIEKDTVISNLQEELENCFDASEHTVSVYFTNLNNLSTGNTVIIGAGYVLDNKYVGRLQGAVHGNTFGTSINIPILKRALNSEVVLQRTAVGSQVSVTVTTHGFLRDVSSVNYISTGAISNVNYGAIDTTQNSHSIEISFNA